VYREFVIIWRPLFCRSVGTHRKLKRSFGVDRWPKRRERIQLHSCHFHFQACVKAPTGLLWYEEESGGSIRKASVQDSPTHKWVASEVPCGRPWTEPVPLVLSVRYCLIWAYRRSHASYSNTCQCYYNITVMDCIFDGAFIQSAHSHSHSPIHTPTAVSTMQGNNQHVRSS